MAGLSIEKRRRSSGGFSYRAVIRVKEDGRIIHQESKTFRAEKLARAWGFNRKDDLEINGIPGKSQNRNCSIGHLIDLYINDDRLWESTGRTKRYVIKMLRDCDIANIRADQLSVRDVVGHCKLRSHSAGPATIYHDVAYLRTLLRVTSTAFGFKANVEVINEAVPVLIELGLIAKSKRRTRRPTEKELARLRQGLKKRQEHRESRIPFVDILDFSILTCMRIGEVCKITWQDLDVEQAAIMVRDRKDPRKKDGNHLWCPLLGGALDIIQRQPKTCERIFPYNPRSVTAGFQRVRKELGIEDLRYHDLRREGASRLFEMGYSIEEVAQVTGHRSFNTLWNVYTQLYPGKIRNLFE